MYTTDGLDPTKHWPTTNKFEPNPTTNGTTKINFGLSEQQSASRNNFELNPITNWPNLFHEETVHHNWLATSDSV
jgi:hypothetical protein